MELTLRPQTAVLPRHSILTIALLFLVLFFVFPLMTSLAEEPTQAPVAPLAPTEQTLFARINEIRAYYGLAPFQLDWRLTQAAEAHAWDMQQRRWGSHWGSDGSSYAQRIARTGYVAARKTEAIGWGHNMERMINWWLNSPVHRGILLSSSHQQIGIGYAGERGNWWVLNAATHR